MTTLGLVGGLGPESTIDYYHYRRILDAWTKVEPGTSPSIVIDSLDVQRGLRLVASDRTALIEYLTGSITRLTPTVAGVQTLDTTALHVDAIVERLRHPTAPRTAQMS